MGVQKYKPTSAARRLTTVSDFSDITRDHPEKSLTEAMKRSGGRNVHGHITRAAPGRRPQAPLPGHRLQAPRQGRRPGQGRHDRVRPEPLRQHRAAALRGRREALHPRPGGRHGRATPCSPATRRTSGRATRCRWGTSRWAPSSTTSSSSPGRGAQMIRSAGVGPADGQGGRLRPGPPALGRVRKVLINAAPPSANSATSTTRSSASARRARAAGWGIRPSPRRGHEPGRPPARRRRGQVRQGNPTRFRRGVEDEGSSIRKNKRTDKFIVSGRWSGVRSQ